MTFCSTGESNLKESAAGERCHRCRPLEDENDVRTCMKKLSPCQPSCSMTPTCEAQDFGKHLVVTLRLEAAVLSVRA